MGQYVLKNILFPLALHCATIFEIRRVYFPVPLQGTERHISPWVRNPRLYSQAASRQKTQKKRQNGNFFCPGHATASSRDIKFQHIKHLHYAFLLQGL